MSKIAIKKVELSKLPQELRRAVEGELAHYKGSKLLGCTMHQSTPWKDKTRVETVYKAYTEWGNLLIVHSTSFGSYLPDGHVTRDSMIAGDIQFFIDNCDWFKR